MRSNSKETPISDEDIVSLYWNRDETAISATDQKYGRYLYSVAYNILNDRLDSEECLNDTYLGTWNRIPPTRPTILQAFLSKLTRNIAVDRYRINSAAKRVPSEMVLSLHELEDCIKPSPSVEEEYAINEIGRILNEYLATLSEREMLIFVWRYYYADRINVIAQMLKISENTVLRELAKIRSGLKERLEKEGYEV